LNSQELRAEIAAAITSVIEEAACYLEEITITPAGKSRIVTVIIDSDSHLNLDQVTVVSRGISEIVEVLPALGDHPFTLEVTSPGVDRPLTQIRHWRKNFGRLVNATMTDGSVKSGRIGETTKDFVEIDGIDVRISDITRALIEIEFKSIKPDDDSDVDGDAAGDKE
jgi:ribosome maturation factor RimP